jgi:hypothetical protein
MTNGRGSIRVQGSGMAAACCAHLLRSAGFHVAVVQLNRPRVPAILLSDSAMALIADVLGRNDLFQNLPRIERRVVAWEPNSTPVSIPHSAAVVSEDSLLERIQPELGGDATPASCEAEWTIYAAHPLPHPAEPQSFGSRMASAIPVMFKDAEGRAAAWIESLEDGWLFALPNAPRSGWLLAVGAPAESLLGASRLVAGQIVSYGPPGGQFPAYPRIASPLCGPGWLACGAAAMAFDPLCGDGTAHAIREAILASAIVRAAAGGAPVNRLLAHYQLRLTAGFQRHLALCAGFYGTGNRGPWWDLELAALRHGMLWCAGQLAGSERFQYRLNGLDLEPLAS